MPISEEQRIQKNLTKLKPLSAEKLKQLQDIELHAIAKFSGQLDELESALGFLRMEFQFGWNPHQGLDEWSHHFTKKDKKRFGSIERCAKECLSEWHYYS